MRRTRRRIVLSGLAVAVVLVGPPVVAAHYANGPGGVSDVAGRPDKGWHFILDAVTHSRNAQLASPQSAEERARDVWAGTRVTATPGDAGGRALTARASDVRLVWTDGAFAVPVPAGATRPSPANATARPPGPFAWMVYGRLRGGPRQMIGMLDYDSGRRAWDIRDGVVAP